MALARTLIGLLAVAATAGDPLQRLENSPLNQPRFIEHTPQRAGYPPCISRWAVPANRDTSIGGWVGGGKLFGKARKACTGGASGDGTWGWDYVGCGHYPGRIFLKFCPQCTHPRTGPYRTDGPKVLDPFAAKPARPRGEEEAHEEAEHGASEPGEAEHSTSEHGASEHAEPH